MKVPPAYQAFSFRTLLHLISPHADLNLNVDLHSSSRHIEPSSDDFTTSTTLPESLVVPSHSHDGATVDPRQNWELENEVKKEEGHLTVIRLQQRFIAAGRKRKGETGNWKAQLGRKIWDIDEESA